MSDIENLKREARRLRHQEISLPKIASQLGVSTSFVFKHAGDIEVDQAPWRRSAREMRLSGKKVHEIAAAFGKSRQSVTIACKGITPPKSEKPARPPRKTQPSERVRPDWWPKAQDMRLQGMKLQEIADSLDVTIDRVRRACKGIVCPIDHRFDIKSAPRPPRQPRKPRTYTKPPPLSEEEKRRREQTRRIRLMIESDKQRPRSPITLPKLSILS